MVTDNYDNIHHEYKKTNEKLDKKYSMLSTILKIAEPLENKIVIDIGCGDGFFTIPLAKKAKHVYGVDNSIEQINKAKKFSKENISFILGDMLNIDYPVSDLISIPFVLDMIESSEIITKLFNRFNLSLKPHGRLIGLIDDPQSIVSNNKKFGTIKTIKESYLKEGAKMTINLFNENIPIITLNVIYHTKETIENCLKVSGFKEIKWHKPIISKDGLDKYGKFFWKEYLENCDVAYFSAVKKP